MKSNEVPNLDYVASESQLMSPGAIISPSKVLSPFEDKKIFVKNSIKLQESITDSQMKSIFSSGREGIFSGKKNITSISILNQSQSLNYLDEAIQLLKITPNNKFELTELGLQMLESFQGPIAIISFAGLFRTGKSYSLNLLLNKLHQGVK